MASEATFYLFISIAVGLVSFVAMGWFTRENQFPVEGKVRKSDLVNSIADRFKTIIVTGASQGYGLSISKKLAQRGANVVLVAQDTTKLKNALQEVSSCALHPQSQRFHYISADLRKSSETDRVVAETTSWNSNAPPDTIWCCAGHCLPGFFVDTSPDVLRGQMDTIYWSAANMAHSILRLWLSPSPSDKSPTSSSTSTRHIVFTASVLAFYPIAGYGPYSPAKAAMRSLSDTLTQELAYYNGARKHSSATSSSSEIKVHTVFPIGIISPGFENEEKLKPRLTHVLEEADSPQDPDLVADEAFAGLARGDYFITTHWIGHLMKGAGYAVSPRNGWGVTDAFWSLAGWTAFRYIGWEYLGKCLTLGEKEGREVKGVDVSPYK